MVRAKLKTSITVTSAPKIVRCPQKFIMNVYLSHCIDDKTILYFVITNSIMNYLL